MNTTSIECPGCSDRIHSPARKCPTCGVRLPRDEEAWAANAEIFGMDAPRARVEPDSAGTAGGTPAPVQPGSTLSTRPGSAPPLAPEPATASAIAAPIAAMVAAAGIGALVWALIARSTGYEVGFVAWALGGLVGAACIGTGGRGTTLAAAGAVLVLAGIVGGKVLGVHWLIQDSVESLRPMFSAQAHADVREFAAAFAAVDTGADTTELREFLVGTGMTEADSAERLADEEVALFLAEQAPSLREMHTDPPSLEEWRESALAEVASGMEVVDSVKASLGGIDLLFVLLGISTAVGMVRRAS